MASRKEAAEHIFLSLSRFDTLRREGIIPGPKGRGAYNLDAVRAAYIEFLASRRPEPTADGQQSLDLKGEIEQEKLDRLRRENAIARRELVKPEILEHYAAQLGSTVKDGLESMVGQIAKRIPHLRASEKAIIKQICAQLSNRIAEFDPDHPRAA